MSTAEDTAAVNLALHQVLQDLDGRPLSPTLVLAYWLVMTNMLTETYDISEDTLVRLYPIARGVQVRTASADRYLN